eukprot:6679162-Prymnesium_polylepis.2
MPIPGCFSRFEQAETRQGERAAKQTSGLHAAAFMRVAVRSRGAVGWRAVGYVFYLAAWFGFCILDFAFPLLFLERFAALFGIRSVSYTHLRAHETLMNL